VSGLTVASRVEELGLEAGDRIVGIDGLVPRDVIDLQLELPGARAIVVERGGRMETLIPRAAFDPAALQLVEAVPGGIRECNNHCEFCFIRGLPGGLRPTLYVFDDDYRYSFLWGNFLTLSNLEPADWARIGYQRLSPLNVSVHATDDAVRRKLLNNRHAPEILPQLRRLGELGIEVNTQIVLCAGLNTEEVLERSIAALVALHPTVRSVSLVPVGLTSYSRVSNIRRLTLREAEQVLGQCERWQRELRERIGIGFVYASDELYLLAGRETLPSASDYDAFPVLSNGVGLLRSMLDDWNTLLSNRRTARPNPRNVVWVTGRLAAPALERMADAWAAYAGWRPAVKIVENHLFGDQVTVSGLLSGGDLIQTLRALSPEIEDIVLPRTAFGFDGRTTLDGVTAEEVGAAHPGRVHLATTPRELLDAVTASVSRRDHVRQPVQPRRRLQARGQSR
jgi:putative radical SAM enzyme (TIGR03279 family)